MTKTERIEVIKNELGFYQQSPLPSVEETEAYYDADNFYSEHSPADWLQKEQREFGAGLWNTYFKYLYNLTIRTNEESVLDWGCGGGWWLKRLQWLSYSGLKLYGVEPSETARGWANGGLMPISQNPLKNAVQPSINAFDDLIFDVISLQLVLEHIANPVEFLTEQVKPRLKLGGRLLITVPNEFNPLQKLVRYYEFIHKVHINYFTPDGLRNLLHHCGFRVVHESSTFPIEAFLLIGLNYRKSDSLGRRCHNFRLKTEKMTGVRIFDLYKWLYKRFGIGRELIFVAEVE